MVSLGNQPLLLLRDHGAFNSQWQWLSAILDWLLLCCFYLVQHLLTLASVAQGYFNSVISPFLAIMFESFGKT